MRFHLAYVSILPLLEADCSSGAIERARQAIRLGSVDLTQHYDNFRLTFAAGPGATDRPAPKARCRDERNGNRQSARIVIDPETRDVVQTVYIRKVEKVGANCTNVEFDKFPGQKDPGK
jgi:hypothetical protein